MYVEPRLDLKQLIGGAWTYRSWRNDPTMGPVDGARRADTLARMLFLEAKLELRSEGAALGGRLMLDDDNFLDIVGTVCWDDPPSMRFQGRGRIGPAQELLIYDYIAWLAPLWPGNPSGRPTLVGSVIRTIPHSGGAARAGYVASFVAVKRDAQPR